LPIGFEYGDDIRGVIYRTTSPERIWTLQWQVQGKSLARDYGVVAILHDKVTGEPVIILASILAEGIEAASEVGFQPSIPGCSVAKSSEELGQTELQAVIEAKVIEDHPGPPTVVAVRTL
jgi:hypothetical protein